MYLIETRNGLFIATGTTEGEAKINFTIEFPNEKIRSIKKYENKAIHISGIGFFSEE